MRPSSLAAQGPAKAPLLACLVFCILELGGAGNPASCPAPAPSPTSAAAPSPAPVANNSSGNNNSSVLLAKILDTRLDGLFLGPQDNSHQVRRSYSEYNPSHNSFSIRLSTKLGLLPPPQGNLLYLTANRFSRYSSLQFLPLSSQPSAVDWRSSGILPPVMDQGGCAASWAFATAAAVESLYGLLAVWRPSTFSKPPTLSRQQLLDCAVPSSQGCGGGSPLQALDFIRTNQGLVSQDSYPYKGLAARSCPRTKSQKFGSITGWEFAPSDIVGLIAVVARQPVIAFVNGRSSTFMRYTGGIVSDPTCYSHDLNHAVLIVGYQLDSSSVNDPASTYPSGYWIIMNSWGSTWGEAGFMRLKITPGNGICGITALKPVYPVLKLPAAGGSCPPLFPCGAGSCKVTPSFSSSFFAASSSYSCDCTLTEQPLSNGQTLVARMNSDGSPMCVPADICSTLNVNPCGTGKCLNDGAGSYSCVCDTGFVLGADTSGQQVCLAAGSGKGGLVYTVRPGDTCGSEIFRQSIPALQTLNGLDCRKTPLVPGQILIIRDLLQVCAPVLGCGQSVPAQEGESCAAIKNRFGNTDSVGRFLAYNPGLQCTKGLSAGQQVCIEGSVTDPKKGKAIFCDTVYDVLPGDTCCSIAQALKLSIIDFLALNLGIDCDRLQVDQEVCVLGGNFNIISGCSRVTYVHAGETCWSIWSRFGISGSAFLALNPGIQCNLLQVGQKVCVGKAGYSKQHR